MSQLLLTTGGFTLGILAVVAIGALGAEVRGWLPHVSRRLVHRACSRLPVDERWREEEWRAEVDLFSDRPVSMVVVAMRILVNAGAVAREARILSPARAPEESSSSLSTGLESDIKQLAKGRVTVGDVWDALESAGLRPHQGALGTAYFALSDDRHVGIPNRGFFDHGIASDEILALMASWGVRPTESGAYPMPPNATPQMCQPVRLRFAKPSG
jgi:hypothetical protein